MCKRLLTHHLCTPLGSWAILHLRMDKGRRRAYFFICSLLYIYAWASFSEWEFEQIKWWVLIDSIKFSLGERCLIYIFINPSCVYNMSWLVASDQFSQLSLLRRRHNVKAYLNFTDEAQNKAETRVCSYLTPCKNYLFKTRSYLCTSMICNNDGFHQFQRPTWTRFWEGIRPYLEVSREIEIWRIPRGKADESVV